VSIGQVWLCRCQVSDAKLQRSCKERHAHRYTFLHPVAHIALPERDMPLHMRLNAPHLRPRTLLSLLTLGAALLVALAAWETSRARRTAERVLHDYAAVIADKLVDGSLRRYRSAVGLYSADEGLASVPLNALLRAHARAMSDHRAGVLAVPDVPGVRYAFVYDVVDDRLVTSRQTDTAEERERLRSFLRQVNVSCGANCLYAFGRLTHLIPTAVPDDIEWGGVLEADASGERHWVYGVRLDPSVAVRSFVVPLILDARDCRCPANLLPASLAGFTDTRAAASFVVRGRDRQVLYRSEPDYGTEVTATVELSEDMPLTGVTVEVAVNPVVVRPLLPYGGRGTPWLLLVVISAAVLGSALLALRALHRENELARARQTFVANVSHELKTPLARIRLFNDLLSPARQTSPEKRERYRTVVDRECRRLSVLVDNVLQFARIERAGEPYEMRPVALAEIVARAIETFRATADDDRLSLSADVRDVPPVLGDVQALEQVVINLLDNAVKYSAEGAPISVTLLAAGDHAEIRVSDRGCGIPEQERARIFEEFYRVQSGDTQPVAGNGLGLAIVRRVARAHAGDVTLESAVGVGSTFIVRIPLSRSGDGQSPEKHT
jgi:signal transduction histidine kinase